MSVWRYMAETGRNYQCGAALRHREDAKHQKQESSPDKVCRGTLLSRTQYTPDVGLWGYRDARE